VTHDEVLLFARIVGLEDRASAFAAYRHALAGQRRKYTGEPYIVHPAAVAGRVRAYGSEALTAAAWMHDLLEDTPTERSEISMLFGPEVSDLVVAVTDVSKPSDGSRAARKKKDRDHLAQAGPLAQTLKLADLIDNTKSILARDRGFARIYLAEKAELLPVLASGWAVLRDEAVELVEKGLASLGKEK
jgi:(p)ppGpp synthase/HD superfamily hydrolase